MHVSRTKPPGHVSHVVLCHIHMPRGSRPGWVGPLNFPARCCSVSAPNHRDRSEADNGVPRARTPARRSSAAIASTHVVHICFGCSADGAWAAVDHPDAPRTVRFHATDAPAAAQRVATVPGSESTAVSNDDDVVAIKSASLSYWGGPRRGISDNLDWASYGERLHAYSIALRSSSGQVITCWRLLRILLGCLVP